MINSIFYSLPKEMTKKGNYTCTSLSFCTVSANNSSIKINYLNLSLSGATDVDKFEQTIFITENF